MIIESSLLILISIATTTSFLPVLSSGQKKIHKQINFFLLISFFSITSLLLYSYTGSYELLAIRETLQNENSSRKLIETSLEKWIKISPNNEQALFLLGNHYMNMNAPKTATKYFFKLYQMNKQSQIIAQYAQSLFLTENAMTPQVQALIKEALAKDENNTTALGLQGINFFEQKNYQQATLAWQKALALETNKFARDSLEIGIQKAQQFIENKNN